MHCEFPFLLLFCMILNSLTTQKSKASDINLLQTYWEYFSFQHYASRSGSVKICKLLLDKGADVNAQTRSGKVTSLHRAAYCGHITVVQCLVKLGADPGLCDSDGQIPLHKVSNDLIY